MSKHLGNVVDPDELIERYGADTVRLATLYAARPQRALNWSDSAVLRCHRFLTQVWDFSQTHLAGAAEKPGSGLAGEKAPSGGDRLVPADTDGSFAGEQPQILAGEQAQILGEQAQIRDTTEHLRVRLDKWCAAAVERVTEEMVALEMHSAVRDVMRLFDRIKDFEKRVLARTDELGAADREALLEALGVLAQLLAPLAPHLAEELWVALGNDGDTSDAVARRIFCGNGMSPSSTPSSRRRRRGDPRRVRARARRAWSAIAAITAIR